MSLDNLEPIRSTRPEQYFFSCVFETNGGSDPDGVVPADNDFTVTRLGVGTYEITFNATKKPLAFHYGSAEIQENEAALSAKVRSYVASTGILTISVYDDDGTPATADTTDKTIGVLCLFTRNSQAI